MVRVGWTTNGQEILALKVTKNATRIKDGRRPAVLYASAQHAREWITPEMTRRLMHHVLDNYGTDPEITRLVDTTELWFLPVANPDGYDYTFTPGNRLWRKNLRDNNGDGQITGGDGVDLNRNFAYKWGYDNEGSVAGPGQRDLPRPRAELRAGDQGAGRALPAGRLRVLRQLPLRRRAAALRRSAGRSARRRPDDVIYEAMVGDDAHPAVPGYDPDISAELYTTNGDTDTHATVRYGTLGFTPEMSTCQTAARLGPGRRVAGRRTASAASSSPTTRS